ncbi:NHL repeat-containing protein [Leptospira fletcheri]|nr:NHL repeat-containing protein [Leptospira fletcheri]
MSHGTGFLLSILLENNPSSSAACTSSPTLSLGEGATRVLGQSDFVSSTSGSATNRLHSVQGIISDSSGGIWVADSSNARVLHFPAGVASGGSADIILGGTAGTALNQFQSPSGLALDSSGGLWVVDTSNERVLHFPKGVSTGGSADAIIGVTGTTGTTSSLLYTPSGVGVDNAGGIWVIDYANFRALHFSAPFSNGMSADLVLGQPNFTTGATGTPSASNLGGPNAVRVDSSGNVWITDNISSRVLRYSPPFTNGMNANLVIGAPNFTSTMNGVTGQNTLWAPSGLSFDSKGNVWVTDNSYRRVTHYSAPFSNGMNADNVLGEPDYASFNANLTVSASTFNNPFDVTVTPCGQVWVADINFNRITYFP